MTTTTLDPVVQAIHAMEASLMCAKERCDHAFVGVNLGGWLLLEEDLWPAALKDTGLRDEWSFINDRGGPADARAVTAMKEHWNTFLTEKDLDTLRAFGVTHCRIPIGYWLALEDAGGEGYVGGGQRYLFRALAWLKQRQMKAVLDLHAMPGGQAVGVSSTGRVAREPAFFMQRDQYERGKEAIIRLAKMVMEFDNNRLTSGVIVGLELMNEPDHHFWDTILGIKELYEEMIPEVRKIVPADRCAILLSFSGPAIHGQGVEWLAKMRRERPEAFAGVFYDAHISHTYGNFDALGTGNVSCNTCCRDPQLLQPLVRAQVPVVVGKYSVDASGHAGALDSWKAYLQNQLSLWSLMPGVLGSFFWNHRVLVELEPMTARRLTSGLNASNASNASGAPSGGGGGGGGAGASTTTSVVPPRSVTTLLPPGVRRRPSASLLEILAGAPGWRPTLTDGLCPSEDLAKCPKVDPGKVQLTDDCQWQR